MRQIILNLDSTDNKLYYQNLIRQGENLASELVIDLSTEFQGYKYFIKFKNDENLEVVTPELMAVDNQIKYPITNALTKDAGTLRIELNAYDDSGMLKKTATTTLRVLEALGLTDEVMPEFYVPWYIHVFDLVENFTTEEAARNTAEGLRNNSEASRDDAEGIRNAAEEIRAEAENLREAAYTQAELNRGSLYATAEGVRNNQYLQAENNRNNDYDDEEQTRNNDYGTAEITRDSQYAQAEEDRNTTYGARVTAVETDLSEHKLDYAEQIDLKLNNIIFNGDFSQNIPWTNGPNAKNTTSSGFLLLEVLSLLNGAFCYSPAIQVQENDLVYARALTKGENIISCRLYLRGGVTSTITIAEETSTIEFNAVSGVGKVAGKTGDINVGFSFESLAAIENKKAYLDNICIVNLTSTFGVGNEPTKDEMDVLITLLGGWFDGNITPTQKQLANWYLKMIRQNRNAIVALGGTII